MDLTCSPRYLYVHAVAKLPNVGNRSQPLPHPLHQEVSLVLAAEIERGALRRGVPLPPERAMCEQLGVSRVTLRKALASLANQGMVVPSHGRAWFVTDSILGELPNVLQGLSVLGAVRGLRVTSRVMLARVRGASLDEADLLEIGPGAQLFEMRRVRQLDDVPVAIDHARLPLDVCPHLPEVDFGAASLYQTLESHGVPPTRCDFAVQAVSAEPGHAEQLGVAPATPLLLAAGTTYDEHDRPIELSRVLFIGERYRFRATHFRRPDARRARNPRGGQT
jgi:GntR family transcriptional regulator